MTDPVARLLAHRARGRCVDGALAAHGLTLARALLLAGMRGEPRTRSALDLRAETAHGLGALEGLERSGLATRSTAPGRDVRPVARWAITDAGREALDRAAEVAAVCLDP